MILSLFLLLFRFGLCDTLLATAYLRDGKFVIEVGKLDFEKGIAFASFERTMTSVGFGRLVVNTTEHREQYNDKDIAFAAGLVEGYLTSDRIWDYYLGTNKFALASHNGTFPQKTIDFIQKQEEWTLQQPTSDRYWSAAQDTIWQIRGVSEGYDLAMTDPSKKVDYWHMHLVFMTGDLIDILGMFGDGVDPKDFTRSEEVDHYLDWRIGTHCSAFLKLTADDVYFGHVAWALYPWMVRMFKTYILRFNNPLLKAEAVHMSSYPGSTVSMDDFYVTGANLGVMETTLSCFNNSLQKLLTPESLFYWERILIANRYTDTPESWMKMFGQHNSGTYPNEWMVVDMEQVIARSTGAPLPKNTIMVGDQIPGTWDVTDVSAQVTANGYFPSYNIPMSKNVYDICGFPEQLKKFPDQVHSLDYNKCARALIMKRDHSKITDIESAKTFIRYNNYTTDPLSLGNPAYVISSRWDLPVLKGAKNRNNFCGGGTDGKITSARTWMTSHRIEFIVSPTYDDNPVFEYSKAPVCDLPIFVHIDQPDRWDFPWYSLVMDLK